LTDSQTVSSSTNGAGERLHVLHNWSWEPSSFPLPSAVRDAVSGQRHAQGHVMELGAWDVRVLIEVD
jgi:beta-galactosidase